MIQEDQTRAARKEKERKILGMKLRTCEHILTATIENEAAGNLTCDPNIY